MALTTPRIAIARVLLFMLLACWVTDAVARSKTDVVSLVNGDRITGEIEKLERGILTFKTESLDTIRIEWDTVAKIVSEFGYELRALDGTLFYGSLAEPSKPGILVIDTQQGPLSMPLIDISQLVPIEAKLWQKLDGSLRFGFNAASSSDVTQYSAGVNATYRTRRWESSADLAVIINQQKPESTSRQSLTYSSLRKWKKRRLTGVLVTAEANEELGLDLRLLVAGAAGRDVVESQRSRLRLAGGIAVNQERRVALATEENVEGLAALSYDLYRFKAPELDLQTRLVLYPGITESGRLRGEATVRLSYEIFGDFDWSLEAYDTYESDPATADQENHDWGVQTSVAWDF